MKTVAAIIPARGGSKGLPRKNILSLGRKPLIAWNIEAAQSTASIDRIFVSTDDPEIASVSLKYGAEVIHRPAEYASDTATSESAILHALSHMNEELDYHPDYICFLQCTSPFTNSIDIEGVINQCAVEGADCGLAVTPFHHFVWKRDDNGQAIGINHESRMRQRRQDREQEFLETGAAYVFSSDGFKQHKHRFFGNIGMHPTPLDRVLEIDELADFELAEQKLAQLSSSAQSRNIPSKIKAIIMDFDGVLTDDKVSVDQDGRESVRCSRSDGMGIERLRKAGYLLAVISKEKNPVVIRRCEKLQIECYHGIDDKITLLSNLLNRELIAPPEAIYVGNDINDIECMQYVGCAVCPQDAHASVKAVAHICLSSNGGKGALRELSDLILTHK